MIVNLIEASTARRMSDWRRQIGFRHEVSTRRGPRPFAVLSYLIRGPVVAGRYLELRHLRLVAVFDQALPEGELATRLVGVACRYEGDELHIGGPDLSKFDKNLRMAPAAGRGGVRLDAADDEFFDFALALERALERFSRHPYAPRRRVPRLPEVTTDARGRCVVDLSALPKRQVLAVDAPERDLVGRAGTNRFDFVNSRFASRR